MTDTYAFVFRHRWWDGRRYRLRQLKVGRLWWTKHRGLAWGTQPP